MPAGALALDRSVGGYARTAAAASAVAVRGAGSSVREKERLLLPIGADAPLLLWKGASSRRFTGTESTATNAPAPTVTPELVQAAGGTPREFTLSLEVAFGVSFGFGFFLGR